MVSFSSVVNAETIGKWDIYEINLTTSNTYKNPYLDVWINATFFNSVGEKIYIDGFWDGESNWKLRFIPTKLGTWNYLINSNDPEFDGIKGTFEVIDSKKKGFIVRDSDHSFAFRRSDGEHIFLMGDTCWNCMSNQNGDLNFSIYQSLIDNRSKQKFNFIRIYIIPFYSNPDSPAHYNEGGRGFEPWNPDRLNPKYFRELDKRIAYANSKGITMNLVLGADQTLMTDFLGWDNGKMERYVRYVMARYSVYDIAWEGRAEFEEQNNTPPGYINLANQIGNWLEIYDPYDHIQSMHTLDSNNELGNENWLDWIMHQSQNWSMIASDRIYNKPVMNEEFYYEVSGSNPIYDRGSVNADTMRIGAWTVMTHGASGFAYGNMGTISSRDTPFKGIEYSLSDGASYMSYLYEFWINTKYWRLIPSNKIVKPGTAFAVSDPGHEYVLYLPTGGTITIDLILANDTLYAEWYNPRNGIYRKATAVDGGTFMTFKAPDSNDWVLYLNATNGIPKTNTSSGFVPFTVKFICNGIESLMEQLHRIIGI